MMVADWNRRAQDQIPPDSQGCRTADTQVTTDLRAFGLNARPWEYIAEDSNL